MRKPYTITKQRERWTDDEHKRFLEALKIYGRAWQRIEEHIGTKTAVQIRSHAQKFFSKLEKEASNNGVPLSHTLDIDIPPPRPKRKPSNPYPRKTSKSATYSPGESTPACLYKEQLHFGRDSASEIDQKADGNEKLERTKTASDSGCHSDVLSLLPDTVCGSISCMSKFSGDEHLSQKRVLVPKVVVTNAESKSSPIMEEDIERWQSCAECSDAGDGKFGCLCLKLQKQTALLGLPVAGTEKMPESLQSNLQCCHDPPNVVALNSVEENKQNSGQSTGCDTRTATSVSQKTGDYASLNAFSDPSMLAASQQFINSSSTQQLSWFHPFAPFHEKLNAHDSFFHMSSAFSNLLVSTLLQNPAAHAAACFAASFLPSTDQESSLNPTSDTNIGGIPSRNLYTPPSVSAITAATVAAATAWWTTHGLFSTYHLPFTGGLAFSSGLATRDSSCPQRKAGSENNARNEKDGHVEVKEDHQMLKPGGSPEVLTTELCTSKISPLSSLDSNDSGRVENPRDIKQKDFDETGQFLPSARVGDHDSNQNSKGNKKHDRSSCGSNTASSSEENDALLEKLDEGEQLKQKVAHASEAASESAYRRCRNGGSINEQWKEVSEEGRLAFQALFSREVLPQSFSPPQAEELNKQENEKSTLLVDLNRKYSDFDRVHVVDEAPSSGSKSLFVTKTVQGRSKTCQTGFKPYKRCSVEVVEDRSSTIEEKCNKRIRSDGACSTIS